MKKTSQLTANILLIFATVTAVTSAIAVTALRIGFTPVLSSSMSPTFHAGDIVLTRPEERTRLNVGDAVILPLPDRSGQRYLHRIVDLQERNGEIHLQTKGDNNVMQDPWTLQIDSDKVPVVIGVIPKMAAIGSSLRTTAVRILIGISVCLFALITIIRASRDIRRLSALRNTSTETKTHFYNE